MNKEDYKKYPNHFVASDIHFNHARILKYNADSRGDGRDFDTLTEDEIWGLVHKMNEKIIANWNSLVGPDDNTFILGDLFMGQMKFAVDILNRMNGFKSIILGNHDRGLMKLPEFQTRESKLAIKVLSTRDYLCFSPRKNADMVFSHFPMSSWDGMSRGSIHCHGHLHGAPVQVINAKNKRIMDVGIDTNNLFPYHIEDVISKMQKIELPKYDHHMKEL
jgi:calcineurin-like phosphoesterase family protein